MFTDPQRLKNLLNKIVDTLYNEMKQFRNGRSSNTETLSQIDKETRFQY